MTSYIIQTLLTFSACFQSDCEKNTPHICISLKTGLLMVYYSEVYLSVILKQTANF